MALFVPVTCVLETYLSPSQLQEPNEDPCEFDSDGYSDESESSRIGLEDIGVFRSRERVPEDWHIHGWDSNAEKSRVKHLMTQDMPSKTTKCALSAMMQNIARYDGLGHCYVALFVREFDNLHLQFRTAFVESVNPAPSAIPHRSWSFVQYLFSLNSTVSGAPIEKLKALFSEHSSQFYSLSVDPVSAPKSTQWSRSRTVTRAVRALQKFRDSAELGLYDALIFIRPFDARRKSPPPALIYESSFHNTEGDYLLSEAMVSHRQPGEDVMSFLERYSRFCTKMYIAAYRKQAGQTLDSDGDAATGTTN